MTERDIQNIEDLPDVFPVFPLPGVLLFPQGLLPLNIFEPRYLNMIDDAMQGDRYIGMVQSPGAGPKYHPEIAPVGTLGEIVSYSETQDGRYLITLRGVSRFQIDEELPLAAPYREVRADWSVYERDLTATDVLNPKFRDELVSEMDGYFERNNLAADRTSLEDAPIEALVNALAAGCPFAPIEKQALLEARDLNSRMECLIALFRMDDAGNGDPKWRN